MWWGERKGRRVTRGCSRQTSPATEYIFVVSNFNEKEVLKKDVEYDVDVTPTENTTVKVYKNSSNDNLLTEDDLLIENNKFKAKKKTEDTYKVVITAKEKPTETEKITLKINS